jgi:hypothetical protein
MNSFCVTIFLRRIKDVKTFNPTHALGFNNYDVNIDTILELWGEDPVHPTPSGYKVLAERLASMVDDVLTDATVNNDPPPQQKKRQAVREPWIVVSEPVAKRLDSTQTKPKQWQQRSQEAGRGRGGPPRGGHHISRGSYSPHPASLSEAPTEAVAAAIAAAVEGPLRADGANGEAIGLPCRPPK